MQPQSVEVVAVPALPLARPGAALHRIAQALRQQKQQQLAQEFVQSLRNKAKIDILM